MADNSFLSFHIDLNSYHVVNLHGSELNYLQNTVPCLKGCARSNPHPQRGDLKKEGVSRVLFTWEGNQTSRLYRLCKYAVWNARRPCGHKRERGSRDLPLHSTANWKENNASKPAQGYSTPAYFRLFREGPLI